MEIREIRVDPPLAIKIDSPNPNDPAEPIVTYQAILKETDGERSLVMRLDNVSFHLLTWELRESVPRPEIFGFMPECLLALNANIEKMVIYDIVDSLFKSYLVVNDIRDSRMINLNIEVTTGLTLAVATKCPIFVSEEIFDNYEEFLKKATEDRAEIEAQIILKNLNPKKVKHH